MSSPILGNFQSVPDAPNLNALARLLQGGSLPGRIVADLGGGRASVNLGGQILHLNLGLAKIPVGQSLVARMMGGQLQIALTQSAGSSSTEAAAQLGLVSARNMASMLGDLGLPASMTNTAVTTALIAAGMPLSREVIAALAAVLGEMEAGQAAALAFLLGRGFPIAPEILANTQRLLQQRPNLGDSLAKILQGLSGLDRDLEELGEGVIPVSRRQSFQEHQENLARHQHQWDQKGDEENDVGEDEPSPVKPPPVEDFQQEERDRLTAPESRLAQGQPPAKESFPGALLLLIADLMKLQTELEAMGLGINLTSLLSLARETFEAIAGERLLNAPDRDPDSPPVFFLAIPIRWENRDSTLELLYKQRSRCKEDGGDLIIRLDLSQTGPLRIQLGWREAMLSIGVRVESSKIAQEIEPHLQQLKEALVKSGFRVSQVSVDTGPVPESLRDEIIPQVGPPQATRGLDVRG